VALFVLVGFAVLPAPELLAGSGYRCPFRAVTGLPCPTCGGTRALHALTRLQFGRAFRLNPLAAAGGLAAALFAPFALLSWACGARRLRLTDVRPRQRRMIAAAVAALVLLNWLHLLFGART
jgi:hypothetical protein